MKKEINNILLQMQNNSIDVGEAANQLLNLFSISVSLPDPALKLAGKMTDLDKFLECSPKQRKELRLFGVIRRFFWKIFGYCPLHGWFLYPKRYRKNAAYVKDEDNYSIGCKYCQQDSNEYYQELWNDYYSL